MGPIRLANPFRSSYRAPWDLLVALALTASLSVVSLTRDAAAQSAGYYTARQPYPASASRAPRAASSRGGLFGGLFGGGSSSRRPGARASSTPYWLNEGSGTQSGYGRYRTLCVRSCDGYYWPVSFSTTRAGFSRDAKQCVSSCAVPAKLYVHRNPGANIEQMVDLKGVPYARTQHAFRYRVEYVKDCRCKPEPWSEAAKQDYAKRVAGADNPAPVRTASNQQSGTPGARIAAPIAPAPRPRAAKRRKARWRVRSDDAQFSGRWWAGSW